MKTFKFLLFLSLSTLIFVSCKNSTEDINTLVDFENVALTSGISDTTTFKSQNCIFTGDPNKFWNGGIVCSSKKDTVTAGYLNQYSCIAGSGALKSTKFGVIYAPGTFTCPANENGAYAIKNIMITNSTYAYLDMKTGSDFSKKFTAGDWFKVIITGYLNNTETASIDYYLADFRDSKTFVSNTWTKVDVSALGKVDKVTFTLDSSDKSGGYINTPAYVCIDNIEFTQTVSTK